MAREDATVAAIELFGTRRQIDQKTGRHARAALSVLVFVVPQDVADGLEVRLAVPTPLDWVVVIETELDGINDAEAPVRVPEVDRDDANDVEDADWVSSPPPVCRPGVTVAVLDDARPSVGSDSDRRT